MTFTTENNTVWMVTDAGPMKLTPEAVEKLLDVFDAEGAKSPFLDLYDAAAKTDWFIPRCSSMRREAA